MQFLGLVLWISRIIPSIVWESQLWLWWLYKLFPDACKEQNDQPMSPLHARLFRIWEESLQISVYSQKLIGPQISGGLIAGKKCNDHKWLQLLPVLSNAGHCGQFKKKGQKSYKTHILYGLKTFCCVRNDENEICARSGVWGNGT